MSFFDHLEELRWRIVKIAAAVVVCSVPCWIFWRQIFDIVMIYPLRFANPKTHLIYTTPAESVLLSFKIAFAVGCIFAAPVVFYQIWRFVSPALFRDEKKIVLPAVAASTIAFLVGIVFCYAALPFLFRILTNFSDSRIDPYFKVNDYLSFIMKLSFSFGVVFELPVVSYVLARMGLLTPGFLIRHSRIAIVIIFVIAAIITPPDIFSQLLLALPLLMLYGLSIVVAHFAGREP